MKNITLYVVSNNKDIYDDLLEAGKNFPNFNFLGGGPVDDQSLQQISIGKPDYVIIQQVDTQAIKMMLLNTPDTKVIMLAEDQERAGSTISELEKEGFFGHLWLNLKEISAKDVLELIEEDLKNKEQEEIIKKGLEQNENSVEKQVSEEPLVTEKDGVTETVFIEEKNNVETRDETKEKTMKVFSGLSSKTIVVHSRRGGVGKTTIAKELANAYAGIRLNKKVDVLNKSLKVCLVDLDFSQGSLRTQLGVNRQFPNIYQWIEDIVTRLENGMPFDKISYDKIQVLSRWVEKVSNDKALYLLHTAQGDLPLNIYRKIEEIENKMNIQDLYTKIIRKIIHSVQKAFDIIVIDTETTLDETTFTALEMADNIIVPINPSVGDIENLKVLVTELKSLKEKVDMSKISLVVNKNFKKHAIDDFNYMVNLVKYETYNYEISETTLKSFPIIASMPYDLKVIQSENLFSLYTDAGGSEFKRGIYQIAENILPIFKVKSPTKEKGANLNKKMAEVKKVQKNKKQPLVVEERQKDQEPAPKLTSAEKKKLRHEKQKEKLKLQMEKKSKKVNKKEK